MRTYKGNYNYIVENEMLNVRYYEGNNLQKAIELRDKIRDLVQDPFKKADFKVYGRTEEGYFIWIA